MKTNKMKQVIGKQIAHMAISATRTEVNSTCPLIAYQPRLPKNAEKLKKH